MLVLLVVEAFVAKRLVKYPVAAVSPPVVEALPVTVSVEMVVVAKVEVPVTERVTEDKLVVEALASVV